MTNLYLGGGLIGAMALALAMGSVANAEDAAQMPQRMQARLVARFQKADVDGNGQLTRREAQTGMPRVYQHFAEIDTGNKGYVTLEQIKAYVAAKMAARQSKAGDSQPEPL